jgi:Secretion system C-terminal sorting domain
VVSIRLTAFPSNATSITVNMVTYLSTDPIWPANGGAGIIIPYTPGTGPTQSICVDPVDGVVSVVVPFASRDNAGKEDPTPGSVTVSYTAILPVNFLNVMAVKQNNTIAVTCYIGQQTDVRHYEVERSDNGVAFAKIGTVSSSNSLRYTFIDMSPLAGVNFYRIKAVDLNGTFKYSAIIKISMNGKGNIQVYPNPVKDVITITGLSGRGNVSIFSPDGRLIDRVLVQGNVMTYNAAGLQPGTYILQYRDEAKTIQNIKITKQ